MKFNFESIPQENKIEEKNFSIEKEIDGLLYSIKLKPIIDNPKTYELSFVANNSESLTNKGLATFNKVVDIIKDFIEETRTTTQIDTIILEGSKEIMDDKNLQESLLKKYQSDPVAFIGFNYENKEDVSFSSIKLGVKTKKIWIDQSARIYGIQEYKNRRSLTDPFQKPTIKYIFNGERLSDFVTNSVEVAKLRRGELSESLPKLLEYLKIDWREQDKRPRKQPDTQRADLYERVLKRRFPECKFTRKLNTIEIHFDILKKENSDN